MNSWDRAPHANREHYRRMHGALPDTPRGWSVLSIVWRAAVIITAVAICVRWL